MSVHVERETAPGRFWIVAARIGASGQPRALVWRSNVSHTDAGDDSRAAERALKGDGFQVFVYPSTERDPLARAKADVLQTRVALQAAAPEGSEDAVESTRRSLGVDLLAARRHADLDRSDLAHAIGVLPSYVGDAESGDIHVTTAYVLRVLRACGLPDNWTAPKPVEQRAVAIAYVRGYEDAVERLRRLVRDTCDKRASEIDDRAALSSLALTRDRVLFAIDEVAEKVAAKRVALEREEKKLGRWDAMMFGFRTVICNGVRLRVGDRITKAGVKAESRFDALVTEHLKNIGALTPYEGSRQWTVQTIHGSLGVSTHGHWIAQSFKDWPKDYHACIEHARARGFDHWKWNFHFEIGAAEFEVHHWAKQLARILPPAGHRALDAHNKETR